MTLVELMTNYRREHGLSQRQFAEKCGLSHGYISILERGFNPSTRKPAVPTLVALKQIADGMGMPLQRLLETVDDMPVKLEGQLAPSQTKGLSELIKLFHALPEQDQALALALLRKMAGE